MGPQRVAIAGHKADLLLPAGWTVAPGWEEPSRQRTHGVYLSAPSGQPRLHVRAGGDAAAPLTREGLVALLRQQGWGVEPVEVATTENDGYITARGTFRLREGPQKEIVEWFITDGRRLGSCCAVDATADELVGCEQIARSLRFCDP
jgi:hypothetical protein